MGCKTVRNWHNKRNALHKAANGKCFYCECLTVNTGSTSNPLYATVEHLIPMHAGGARKRRENLVIACRFCNNMKNQIETFYKCLMTPELFQKFIKTVDRNRHNDKIRDDFMVYLLLKNPEGFNQLSFIAKGIKEWESMTMMQITQIAQKHWQNAFAS